ncbi:PrgI family protein [Amycolatopsis sp. K13G38]|uniref:PrgI family protein n=1 Tax=Amycolatopsis acididurans TaxID=2724524 RepID=A0ABX1JH06_9PSEU|nr:PrgI family protein [Amycolatopsis acididurans]NKQ59024.1 PrgI family protein [Amycolatopsis acididurans]
MADRVLGPLTARQLGILAVTGLVLYAAWSATRAVLPVPVFLALAIPVAATAVFLALGQRDGISLDRLLVAAIRQRMGPRHRVAAPEGVRPAPEWLTTQAAATSASRVAGSRKSRPAKGKAPVSEQISPSALRLPAEAVTDTGVVDLGSDGLAVVAVASTVNFALRTPAEQEALVASFGRYLHSLTAPVQVLVRTERLDLSGQISELRARAGGRPHPALEAAALEHADYLVQLAEQTDLLRRQVLLILREPIGGATAAPADGLGGPGPLAVLSSLARGKRRATTTGAAGAGARRAAESRLVRRLGEAIELLAPAGIVITPLDAGQATAVLASACNPDTLLPPSAALAGADDVITTAGGDLDDDLTDDRTFWPPDGRAEFGQDQYDPDDGEDDDWDDEDDQYDDGDFEERGRL